MAKCKNCNNLYNLSNENDEIVGKRCPKISDSPDEERERECAHYNAMTNADRIRCMTDEELAEILFGECTIGMGLDDGCPNGISDVSCKECILEWLKQESVVQV